MAGAGRRRRSKAFSIEYIRRKIDRLQHCPYNRLAIGHPWKETFRRKFMTQEQMERAIHLVVQHHAQFAADIQQLGEEIQQLKNAQAVTEQNLQQMLEAQTENEKRFAQLAETQAEAQARNDLRFAQMAEAIVSVTALYGRSAKDQDRIEEAQRRQEEKLVEAEERWRVSMNETNHSLKDLILVVERYIHSRNGNSENHGG
jgi:hypothetical protein